MKSSYISAKKEFRIRKRFNLRLKRDYQLRKLNDLFKLNKQEFWTKLKQSRKESHSVDVPIAVIKDEYTKLFNTGNETNPTLNLMNENKINEFMNINQSKTFKYKVGTLKVEDQMINLPNGKSVGISGVRNEMIKYCHSPLLPITINILFEKMINFSVIPTMFNVSIIKPIIKNVNKDTADITNLRPVAVSDTLTNLFEAIILEILNNQHKDDKKQFGFKKSSSCNHAVFVLYQAIKASKARGTRLYVCAIDASKAFDKINRLYLWLKLIEHGIDPCIIMILIKYYAESKMLVSIGEELSDIFGTTTGVRQGGACSPKLFNIYIEGLIESVENNLSGI